MKHSVFCCSGSSPAQFPSSCHYSVSRIRRCVSLTRQSVGRGPVQPAAQCSLQQSLGEGPLHLLEHCWAQFSFVTGSKNRTESVEWWFNETNCVADRDAATPEFPLWIPLGITKGWSYLFLLEYDCIDLLFLSGRLWKQPWLKTKSWDTKTSTKADCNDLQMLFRSVEYKTGKLRRSTVV